MLECGKVIEADCSESFLPVRQEDGSVNPGGLQLEPSRLAGPQTDHEDDRCLLSDKLCQKTVDQGLRREAPCILAREGEKKTVACDNERVWPP